MKARHVVAILIAAGLIAWTLISCKPSTAVSISERISSFQDDLNTTARTNVYKNFHPDETADYGPLGSSDLTLFNTTYPPPGAAYSLSIVDSSNPSAGVIVVVNTGGHAAWTAPYYLKLTMDTFDGDDWRIVTLSDSQTNGSYTLRFD